MQALLHQNPAADDYPRRRRRRDASPEGLSPDGFSIFFHGLPRVFSSLSASTGWRSVAASSAKRMALYALALCHNSRQ